MGWTSRADGDAARSPRRVRPAVSFLKTFSRLTGVAPAQTIWLDQVHGARVRVIVRPPARGALIRCDGAVTRLAGQALGVRSADCVPILLWDDGGRAVGALHAGWRGLLAGIVDRGVTALCRAARVKSARVRATLGPCIFPERYEVGPEVRRAFVERYGPAAARHFTKRRSRWAMSMPGMAAWLLRRAGVGRIGKPPYCTAAQSRLCWSHRARGESGRIATYILKDRSSAWSIERGAWG